MVMDQNLTPRPLSFKEPGALWPILKTEKRWYLGGAIFAFFLASVLISGWPQGLIPNTAYPYGYSGDSVGYSWLIQRAMEGWVFDNPRNGYPFGSNFLDYPGSDAGTIALLKIIGLLSGSFYAAFNLYFLLTFSLIFISTYIVLRSLDLSKSLAAAAALTYAFLPFHFLRLGHYFFVSYFVAPLFFYAAIKVLLQDGAQFFKKQTVISWCAYCVGFVVLASFGVYYALFGTILIGTAALIRFFQPQGFKSAMVGFAMVGFIVLGVGLNTAPSIVYKKLHGSNVEVMHRNSAEGEVYGLKMMQLFMPHPSHRIPAMANAANKYNQNTPLVNENFTSSLGVIGSLGFLLIAVVLLKASAGNRSDKRLIALAGFAGLLFLFATIGGLGSLFSMVISSSIRGWNRISVFIGFGAVALFFIMLQWLLQKYISKRRHLMTGIVAIFLGGIALYDQTGPTCVPCNLTVRDSFQSDQQFIQQVEALVPPVSAIYQLPYNPFPEAAVVYKLDSYDILSGFLHSKTLKWNLGGIKGRDGDLFYRSLADEPLTDQIKIIERLGFAGIFVDKRGFADYGESIIEQLTLLLGVPPSLQNKRYAFFKLSSASGQDLSHMTPEEIMVSVGYLESLSLSKSSASFNSPLLFNQPNPPDYIKEFKGLSAIEPWGRWSDATLSPEVLIRFNQRLPRKFELVLVASSFTTGPKQTLTIKVGSKTYEVPIGTAFSEIRVAVDLGSEAADTIALIPEKPETPSALGLGEDVRKLGVGLISLQIQTNKQGGLAK
jgi:phosphoglycerol transferase